MRDRDADAVDRLSASTGSITPPLSVGCPRTNRGKAQHAKRQIIFVAPHAIRSTTAATASGTGRWHRNLVQEDFFAPFRGQ